MERRILQTAEGCIVTVKVTPRASRDGCAGAEEGWFRIRLQAPPVDNKANESLAGFLSGLFGIPRRAVRLVAGGTSRVKRVALAGVSPAAAEAKLGGKT